MRRTGTLPALAALVVLTGLAWLASAGVAVAEYRAYELTVVDRYACRVQEQDPCESTRVVTTFGPRLYVSTHGGSWRTGVQLMATWVCRGNTSYYQQVCPRPQPRNAKFDTGERVEVRLEKHITQGWLGEVELAYYDSFTRTNIYGVRFPERDNVYARYFEKDLNPAAAQPQQAQGGQQPQQQ